MNYVAFFTNLIKSDNSTLPLRPYSLRYIKLIISSNPMSKYH